MTVDQISKAAERAKSLLRNRSDVSSVGISRSRDGDLCVRVDVDPETDKKGIEKLLAKIGAPVIIRAVTGLLRAH